MDHQIYIHSQMATRTQSFSMCGPKRICPGPCLPICWFQTRVQELYDEEGVRHEKNVLLIDDAVLHALSDAGTQNR